jgi:hypothetical protein
METNPRNWTAVTHANWRKTEAREMQARFSVIFKELDENPYNREPDDIAHERDHLEHILRSSLNYLTNTTWLATVQLLEAELAQQDDKAREKSKRHLKKDLQRLEDHPNNRTADEIERVRAQLQKNHTKTMAKLKAKSMAREPVSQDIVQERYMWELQLAAHPTTRSALQ